jgi:hypothetical protein
MPREKRLSAGAGAGRLAGALCVALLVLGFAASPASAQTDQDKPPPTTGLPGGPVPGGFRSWAELLEAQERLNTVAEQLAAAAEAERGFTGIEAAPELGRVRLFWHGALPARVAEVVAKVGQEVPVEVRPAPYALSELVDQQAAIAAEPGVSSVGPYVDGSGLAVRFAGSEREARALPAIRAATVPVTVEPFERMEPAGCTGRQDDCSWYWGGARYNLPLGWCSTGFSLSFASFFLPPPPPTYRMLSAGHCGSNGQAVTDGGGEAMGTITGDSNAKDLLLINPAPSLSFGPRVYLGAWNASTLSNKAVKGSKASFVGNWVCTSGAATGEHCSVQVELVNVTINLDGTLVNPAVIAEELTGGVAVGQGDSGGPVLVHQWFGGGVWAYGTISGLGDPVPCPPGSPSPLCGSTVAYVDITTALAHYKPPFGSVSVRTG